MGGLKCETMSRRAGSACIKDGLGTSKISPWVGLLKGVQLNVIGPGLVTLEAVAGLAGSTFCAAGVVLRGSSRERILLFNTISGATTFPSTIVAVACRGDLGPAGSVVNRNGGITEVAIL